VKLAVRLGVGVSHGFHHYGRRDGLGGWGSRYRALLSIRALGEGVDVPGCSTAVVMASGLSPRQLIQRAGRVLRPGRGEAARVYVLVARATWEHRVLQRVRSVERQLR